MTSDPHLPSISVIVPSFNQAPFLKEALDSILADGYPSLEVLVMDGGSTDGSVEILKSYGSRVQWVSERDHGQSDALNKGLARAAGEVIGWLNSDDRYEPGAVMAMGLFFAENPETMWAIGRVIVVDGNGREIRKFVSRYKDFKLAHYSFESHLVENYVGQMGVFFRRKAVEAAGPLNRDRHYAMDYDLWLRFGKRWKPGILPRVIGHFRMYENTKSMSSFQKQFDEDYAVAAVHAQGHPRAGALLAHHRFNNALIVTIYKVMAWLRKRGQKS